MSNYIIGSQAWYDDRRKRLVDIAKELGSVNELTEDEKERLYIEQCRIVSELEDNWNETLINSPLSV